MLKCFPTLVNKNIMLKSGMSAFWDTFAGLIPVKVLSITGDIDPRPSSKHNVKFIVTNDTGPYKKGETFDRWSLDVIPPSAVHRRQYCTTIGFYKVQIDTAPEKV